jgi:hypothetical protein
MFRELLDNPNRIEPGPLQAAARKQFPDVVRRSHLEFFKVGQHAPYNGKYALIGIAVYSPKELELLDAIDAAYSDWRGTAKVAVFDLMECKDPRDALEHYFPPPPYGLGPLLFVPRLVPQSPIVGVWDGAVLKAIETGLHDAQKLLRNEGLLK